MGWSSGRHLEKMSAFELSVPLVALLTPVFALVWRVEYFFRYCVEATPQYDTNAQVSSNSHIAFEMSCVNVLSSIPPFIAPCTISPPRMEECVQHWNHAVVCAGGEGGIRLA